MTDHKKALARVRTELENSTLEHDSKVLAEQQLDSADSVLVATNGDQLTKLCQLTASNTAALVSHIVVSADQAATVSKAALEQADRVEKALADQAATVSKAALEQAATVKTALAAAEKKLSDHIDQPFSRVGSEQAAPIIAGTGAVATFLVIVHALTPWRWALALAIFSPFSASVVKAVIAGYEGR